MFRSLTDFLEALRPEAARPRNDAHAQQLACAVLLVEVMRGEGGPQPVERAAVCEALRRRFGLANGELRELGPVHTLFARCVAIRRGQPLGAEHGLG